MSSVALTSTVLSIGVGQTCASAGNSSIYSSRVSVKSCVVTHSISVPSIYHSYSTDPLSQIVDAVNSMVSVGSTVSTVGESVTAPSARTDVHANIQLTRTKAQKRFNQIISDTYEVNNMIVL